MCTLRRARPSAQRGRAACVAERADIEPKARDGLARASQDESRPAAALPAADGDVRRACRVPAPRARLEVDAKAARRRR